MADTNIIVRQESPTDYPAIYNVNIAAFKRSEEANLVDRLRSTNSFVPDLSMVATAEGKVIGYILFTKINIVGENCNEESLALAPIAIHPEWQSKGVGSTLIRNGLNKAKDIGYKSVVVLGHQDYYPRFGFIPTNKWGIKPPFNVPAQLFMGLELQENAFADMNGTVVTYSKEFKLA